MEAQEDDRALTVVEDAHACCQRQAILAAALLIGGFRHCPVSVRKRDRFARQLGLQRAFQLLLVGAKRAGELLQRGRVPEGSRQLAVLSADLAARSLQPARYAQRGGAITQMAADLAVDGRRRERGERDTAARVEAVACLDQADRPDLNEIVE